MGTIKDKAANGLFWAIMEKGGKQFIQFTLGIVIARHLTPADYGIVGMLAIFMAISGVLLDSGIESALVQKQNRTDEDKNGEGGVHWTRNIHIECKIKYNF